MQYDLSILIPARNEEFLSLTVKDILEHKRGNTEIIVVLDGQWADPPLPQHPDLKVVYLPESIGQRAAQNLAAKISTAKYVAKTDAHCAFDEGFDVKLMEAMEKEGDDVTIVPVMRNLHIFNWVCKHCGMETYQGPEPDQCRNETCSFEPPAFEKKIVWIPKESPQSSAYRFNKNLQFKYFPELKAKQPKTGLAETMSLQGSFFMCTREKYWELGLCDESWGSWGQQGSEVALKTWLSGGRVLVHMDTWYAHLFRTQKGFSFPYPMSGQAQQKAREISQDIFLNNKWDKQIKPLSWLLNKFWFALKEVQDPEARWTENDLNMPTKSIIYYCDNQLNIKIAKKVQKQLESIGLPIVSASLKPMDFGKNIHVPLERGTLTMFKQILTALENTNSDIVYFCEADVLYHPTHFDFTPPRKDVWYYNTNVWKVDAHSDFAFRTADCRQVSGICVYRDLALEHYRKRVEMVEQNGYTQKMGYEPGTHSRAERVDNSTSETWESEFPNLDIRHDNNFSPTRWSPEEFRNKKYAEGWTESNINEIGGWSIPWPL